MNVDDLQRYKKELQAEHQDEIAAIDRLIARERSKFNGSTSETPPMVRYRRGTAGIVREAVLQIESGKDFTRRDAERRIAENHPTAEIDARQIGIELWALAKANVINTVRAGRGRIPAVYRR